MSTELQDVERDLEHVSRQTLAASLHARRTDPTELQELENGLTSGFWARLVAHAAEEWGPAGGTYQHALQQALTGPVGSEVDAVQRLKCVAYAQAAIERLVRWPETRAAELRHARAPALPGPSRRGPGL